jgi:hypothetical protein
MTKLNDGTCRHLEAEDSVAAGQVLRGTKDLWGPPGGRPSEIEYEFPRQDGGSRQRRQALKTGIPSLWLLDLG